MCSYRFLLPAQQMVHKQPQRAPEDWGNKNCPPKTATSVWSPQNELALIKYTKMLVLRWGFAWYCSNFVWYSASKDRRNVIKILVKQKDAILVLPDWPQNFHNCDRNSDFGPIVSYHPGLLWHKHGTSCVFCNHWRKLNKNMCQIIAIEKQNLLFKPNQRGARIVRGVRQRAAVPLERGGQPKFLRSSFKKHWTVHNVNFKGQIAYIPST